VYEGRFLVTGRGRIGGGSENMARERGKNSDKKVVMVKLIIQKKKKNRHSDNKMSCLPCKSSGLIPLMSYPVGICAAPFVRQLGVETAGVSPPTFPGLLGCSLQWGL
jgi:hypothetical protein